MTVQVTTYHFEMTRREQLKPARLASGSLDLTRAMIPSPELNRYLYSAVGAGWYWVDRLSWTYDTWMEYLDRPELETWVARVSGTPAGYFELEAQPGGSVEIAYFGLLPRFVGQGLGGPLLTAALERGWEMGAARVWVHTCTLDHPAALANYRARGMQLFKEVVSQQDLPDSPPGPWPGAG